MQDDHEKSVRIEAVSEDTPLNIEWQGAADLEDDTLDGVRDGLNAAMAGEAARQMLIGSGLSLSSVTDNILGAASDDWLSDTSVRVDAGQSDYQREDLIYQSPDWDRATGREDNKGVSELIG
ncbi:MAG: hypothetical protein AAF729_04385 [Pseudomonadota bacterium]